MLIMPVLEMLELEALILCSISSIIFSLFVAFKRRDLWPFRPGFFSWVIALICTNAEAFAYADAFNVGEHVFYMLTAVFLFLGVCVEFYKIFLKDKIVVKREPVQQRTWKPKENKGVGV